MAEQGGCGVGVCSEEVGIVEVVKGSFDLGLNKNGEFLYFWEWACMGNGQRGCMVGLGIWVDWVLFGLR